MAVATTQSNGKVAPQDVPIKGSGRSAAAPGSRLAEAFEAVERFPVLIESRERVIAAATAETARVGELVEAVESDVSLAISVLRFANRSGVVAGGVGGIPEAIEVLKPSGVLAIAGTAPSFDFFESNGGWELKPERFRVHALATQRAADEIGRTVGWVERDELAVAALLHDIGRLVISRLHPGYKVYFDALARTPEQRLRDEREQLGIDHALVGGVLARRWNLPQRIAVAIERHHAEDAEGLAAMVATADMVAHYSQGEAVSPERLRASAERCGARADGAARPALRAALSASRRLPGSASPVRSRPASWTSSATSPRAWSTSRSPARCSSRSRPSAPTCTTSTARSAPSTGPRRCSPPATAAGSSAQARGPRHPASVDQALAQRYRDRVGAVAGAEAGQGVLDVGLDGLFAEVEFAGGDRRRLAVGEQLQDLALAAGQLAAAAFRRHRRVDEALLGRRRRRPRGAARPAPAVRAT